MSDTRQPNDKPVAHAVAALLRNPFVIALLLVFLAFEVYNTAILPAIRGTIDTRKSVADVRELTGDSTIDIKSEGSKRTKPTAAVAPYPSSMQEVFDLESKWFDVVRSERHNFEGLCEGGDRNACEVVAKNDAGNRKFLADSKLDVALTAKVLQNQEACNAGNPSACLFVGREIMAEWKKRCEIVGEIDCRAMREGIRYYEIARTR